MRQSAEFHPKRPNSKHYNPKQAMLTSRLGPFHMSMFVMNVITTSRYKRRQRDGGNGKRLHDHLFTRARTKEGERASKRGIIMMARFLFVRCEKGGEGRLRMPHARIFVLIEANVWVQLYQRDEGTRIISEISKHTVYTVTIE